MLRRIIEIDREKCNGCGACVSACHEGAIVLEDGKAKLIKDDYCDGLGDCLPHCPTGAITFVEREAAPYDEAAVLARQKEKRAQAGHSPEETRPQGCPGKAVQQFSRADGPFPEGMRPQGCPGKALQQFNRTAAPAAPAVSGEVPSELLQWPIQIKLAPVNAPFFAGAKLLIAADCTAYAYGNFHRDFMRGKVTLIGCPKLDEGDYTEKLTAILKENDIKSLTVVRMEVPCCGGMENAAVNALKASGKFIPWQVITLSRDGRVLD